MALKYLRHLSVRESWSVPYRCRNFFPTLFPNFLALNHSTYVVLDISCSQELLSDRFMLNWCLNACNKTKKRVKLKKTWLLNICGTKLLYNLDLCQIDAAIFFPTLFSNFLALNHSTYVALDNDCSQELLGERFMMNWYPKTCKKIQKRFKLKHCVVSNFWKTHYWLGIFISANLLTKSLYLPCSHNLTD